MKAKTSLRVIISVLGACAIFAGTARANDSVYLFINSKLLDEGAKVENGKTMAPVRALAEAMGGNVIWDNASRSVNIQTAISEYEVAAWIKEQGKKENDYYFDGLSVEALNIDEDSEPEILARIDAGVHLGDFFIFDKQDNDSYKLLYEQPWHVESWGMESFNVDGKPLFRVVTRDGGTGTDAKEAHLMYMKESGTWIEAWSGKLKEQSTLQDQIRLMLGNYQFNDDNGQLFYWQTEVEQSGESKTTTQVFELQQGRFVEKE